MLQNFCVRASLIALCFFSATNLTAGVSADTTIQTQEGPKPIRILKIGDKILCSNMKDLSIEERAVSAIQELEATRVVEITTSDNVTFYATPDQKLFVTHKWVEAQQLTLEDVLLTKDRTFVKVVSIRHLEQPMTLRFITVDEHHNFFAAENGVLIHNAAGGAMLGCWLAMAVTQVAYHSAVHGIGLLSGPAYPVVTGTLYMWTGPAALTATHASGICGAIIGGVGSGPI